MTPLKINKKVKNAKTDDIFKSALERRAAALLLPLGFKFEETKYTLQQSFRIPDNLTYWVEDKEENKSKKGLKPMILSITYTPDFVFEDEYRIIIIEMKGFKTDRYNIIKKLFLNHLREWNTSKTVSFYEVKKIKSLENILNNLKITK